MGSMPHSSLMWLRSEGKYLYTRPQRGHTCVALGVAVQSLSTEPAPADEGRPSDCQSGMLGAGQPAEHRTQWCHQQAAQLGRVGRGACANQGERGQ